MCIHLACCKGENLTLFFSLSAVLGGGGGAVGAKVETGALRNYNI